MPRGDRGGAKGRKRQTLKVEPKDVERRVERRREQEAATRWAAPRAVFVPGRTVYEKPLPRAPVKPPPGLGLVGPVGGAKKKPAKAKPARPYRVDPVLYVDEQGKVVGRGTVPFMVPAGPRAEPVIPGTRITSRPLTLKEKSAARKRLRKDTLREEKTATDLARGRPLRVELDKQPPNVLVTRPEVASRTYWEKVDRDWVAQQGKVTGSEGNKGPGRQTRTAGIGGISIPGISPDDLKSLAEHSWRTTRNLPGSLSRALYGIGGSLVEVPEAAWHDFRIADIGQFDRSVRDYDFVKAWKGIKEAYGTVAGGPSLIELARDPDLRRNYINEEAERSELFKVLAKSTVDFTTYMVSDGPVIVGYSRYGTPIYRSKKGGRTQDPDLAARGRLRKWEEDPVPVIMMAYGGAAVGLNGIARVGAALERTRVIPGSKFTKMFDPETLVYRTREGQPAVDPSTGAISEVQLPRGPVQKKLAKERRKLVRFLGTKAADVATRATGTERDLGISEHARAVRMLDRNVRRQQAVERAKIIDPLKRSLTRLSGPERVAVLMRDIGGRGPERMTVAEFRKFIEDQKTGVLNEIERLERELDDPSLSEIGRARRRERIVELSGQVRDHTLMQRATRKVTDEMVEAVDTTPKLQEALTLSRRAADAGGDILEELDQLTPETRLLRHYLPIRVTRGARFVEESDEAFNLRTKAGKEVERLQKAYDEANEAAGRPIRTSEAEQLGRRIEQIEALRVPRERPRTREEAEAELERLDAAYEGLVDEIVKRVSPYEARMKTTSGKDVSLRQWEQQQRNRLGGKGGRRGARKSVRQEERELAERHISAAAEANPRVAESLRRRDELREQINESAFGEPGGEPPVPEGHVRLYRGEPTMPPMPTDPVARANYKLQYPVTPRRGSYFSPDRATAENFARNANNGYPGTLLYVDVPKGSLAGEGRRAQYVLPADVAESARPLWSSADVEGAQFGTTTSMELPSARTEREVARLRRLAERASGERGTGLDTWENQAARDAAVELAPRLEHARRRLQRINLRYKNRYGHWPTDEQLGRFMEGPEVDKLIDADLDVGYVSFARRVSPTAYQRAGKGRLAEPDSTRRSRGIAYLTSQWLPDPAAAHLNAFIAAIGFKHALERGRAAFSIGKPLGAEGGRLLEKGYVAVVNQDAVLARRRGTTRPSTREAERVRRAETAEETGLVDSKASESADHARLVVKGENPADELEVFVSNEVVTIHDETIRGWIDEYGAENVRQISKQDDARLFGEFKPGGPVETFFRKLYDPVTDIWRTLTLTLRPAWVVNNIVGNTLLYAANHAFSGGMKAYARAVRYERDELGRIELGPGGVRVTPGADGKMVPLAIRKTGFTEIERPGGAIRGSAALSKPGALRATRGFRQIAANVGWAAARFEEWWLDMNALLSDNIPRTASWFRVVQSNRGWINRQLGTKYTWEELARELTRVAEEPRRGDAQLRRIHDRLVDQVLEQQVDFSRMSEFERSWIRRVVPFYSWMRGMTAALAHFAWSSPAKTALMVEMGMANEQELQQKLGRAYEIMRGSVPIEGQAGDVVAMLGTVGLNPWATPAAVIGIGSALVSKETDPAENPLLQMNPIIQALVAASVKRDIFSGKPIEGSRIEIFGKRLAFESTPQAKMIRAAVMPPEATTAAGEPRLTPPSQKAWGIPYEVLSYWGIPIRKKNLEAARAIVRKQMPELEGMEWDQAEQLRKAASDWNKLKTGVPFDEMTWPGVKGSKMPVRKAAELDHRYQIAEHLALRTNPEIAAIQHKDADKRTKAEKLELGKLKMRTLIRVLSRAAGMSDEEIERDLLPAVDDVTEPAQITAGMRYYREQYGVSVWSSFRTAVKKELER